MGLKPPDLHAKLNRFRDSFEQSQQVQSELDRRVFHLKTLYDVSKDLFGSVEPETILKNGLLMAMGNFGVAEGLAVLVDPATATLLQIVSMGFQEGDAALLLEKLSAVKAAGEPGKAPAHRPRHREIPGRLGQSQEIEFRFTIFRFCYMLS